MKWPKTLMVVSHARDFLNVVCTDILHLHSRKLTSYKGDFDTFERTATERLRNAKKAAEGQERQRAHMQASLHALTNCFSTLKALHQVSSHMPFLPSRAAHRCLRLTAMLCPAPY